MADAAAVAAPPVAEQTTKEKNKARLEELKKKKETAKAAQATGAVAAPGMEKAPKAPRVKAEKTVKPCKCGCGGQTTAFFVPGHDARFKGWLLAIEKGTKQIADLPPAIQKEYKWTKRGKGSVPDKNYKGENYIPQLALEDTAE